MRIQDERYMRSKGLRTALERCHLILQKDGEATTRELLDKINDWQVCNSSQSRGTLERQLELNRKSRNFGEALRKSPITFSIYELGQALRVSPFFGQVGERDNYKVYELRNVVEIIAKKRQIKHLKTLPNQWPRFAQQEWVRQGGEL